MASSWGTPLEVIVFRAQLIFELRTSSLTWEVPKRFGMEGAGSIFFAFTMFLMVLRSEAEVAGFFALFLDSITYFAVLVRSWWKVSI